MTIPDGVYHIDTAQSAGQCIDVIGESTANQANACIGTYHSEGVYSGNNQVFKISTYSADVRIITVTNCGKCLEAYGSLDPSGGENIDQYDYHGRSEDQNQRWVITDSGNDYTVDGTVYDGYRIGVSNNTNLLMDAEGKSFKNGTNVFLCANNGGDNQIWVFHRDLTWDKWLPVPRMGVTYATGTVHFGEPRKMWVGTSETLYPACQCSGNDFQWRWRERGRWTDTDAWSAWSAWKSPTGSIAESGWGDPWAASESVGETDGIHRFTHGISAGVDQGTYDRRSFQVECRRYQPNGGAYGATHGSPSTITFDSVFVPTVTMDGFAFSPDGMEIGYSSNFTRGGNSVLFSAWAKVDGSWQLLIANHYESNINCTGTFSIPMSELHMIPADGAEISIWHTWSTCDETFPSRNILGTVAYTANHGTSVSATYEATDGAAYKLALAAAHSSAECWTETDGAYYLCEKTDSTHFTVVPYLGRVTRVFLAVKDGTAWATQFMELPALTGFNGSCIWNFDGDYTILRVGKGESPKLEYGVTPDFEAQQTSGRDFESVWFGQGSSSDPSASGAIVVGDEHSDVANFEKLAKSHYAVWRTLTGERMDVAVTGVKFGEIGPQSRTVDVSMKRRS